MQPIQGAPRQNVSVAAINGLLQSDASVQITAGCERLNNALALVQDISGYLLPGSTVASEVYATIHRSCSLRLSSDVPLDYLTDFVKPYVVMTNPNTGVSARFNVGVYALESPEFQIGALPSELAFSGLDLLYYLNQPIGDSFEVGAGVDPVQAAADLIVAAFPAATVSKTLSGKTTAQVYTWPYGDSESGQGSTYLSIVNDLMGMVGYLGVWVDWDGTFRLQPYVSPALGAVEWFFNITDSDNIISEDRASQQDYFSVPNWWRFTMQNLTAAPVEGSTMFTYIDTNPDNPGSYPNRGRYVKKTMSVDAVDFATLQALGMLTVSADLTPTETFSVRTSPFPLAWHRDLIALTDPNIANIPPLLSTARRLLARSWTLPLDGSDDMSWTWQTVPTTT